jgi:hypothetical protein
MEVMGTDHCILVETALHRFLMGKTGHMNAGGCGLFFAIA